MNLTNARSGEDGVALDPRAALQIRSCETVLEDTSEVDKQQRIDYVAASAHGVSLDFSYPYETVKNIVRARYSMSSVMQLVTRREQSADLTYTHLALVRPDVVVLAPLDWRGIGKGEIRVPNSQDFWGLNDRLAYGSSSSMMAVYGGMWQALVSGGLHMDAEQTAEQLLCYQVARHNVPVSLQPACLARVRANSEIEDLDLLATPKRPTDLKCAGRKGDGLPPNMSLDLVKRPTDWSHGCPALRDFVQQHSQWTFETPFVPLQPSRMKLSDVKDRTERHLGFTQWQSFQGEDRTTLPGERAPCIVVLAFDRPDLLDALLRRLNVMDYGADFGSVALTISIDAAPKGDGPASSRDVYARVEESVAIARNFTFFAGVSRLRIRTSHAGMVGQWLDAWRPEMDETDEHMACAILEDDLIPSAQAWRWTKGALDEYSVHLDRVGSLSWQRPTLVPANNVVGREVGVMPPSTGGQPFLYRLLGTWGFVALRDQWISFRRWFDQRVLAGPPPSVDFQGAKILPSLWFETKPADSMWSIWYIQYMADNDLFTLYANLDDETKTLCENARPTYGVNAHPGQAPDFQVLEGHDRALDRFPPFSALSLYDWDARKAQSRMQLVDQIEQRAQPTASTSFRRATRRGGALCTMSGAQNIPELELMLRSFVLFHEAEPKNVSGVTSEPIMIHVDADVATAAWLRNTPRIRKATHGRLVVTTGLQQFAGLSKEQMQQMGLWLWLQKHKIYVLRAALQRGYSYALWADADILFMAPLPQYELWHSTTWQDRHRDHHLGLSPHLINGNFSSRFGYYNAGYLVVRSGEPLEIWDSEIDAFHKENPESTTPDQVPMETVSSKVPFFTVTPGENVGWWRLIASHNREHSDMLDRFACETLDDQPYGRITFNGHLLRSLHFHTSRPQTGPEGARHFDLERTLKVLRYLLQDCRHEYSLTLIDEILQRMSDNRRRELRFGKVPNLARAYLQSLPILRWAKLGINGCVQRPSRAAATNKPEIKPDELVSVPGATSAERHRYLVSKKGDRAAAAKSLRAHLEWRRTSLPVPEERAPVPEWIYQYGTARDGTPVIMCHPQRYSVEVASDEDYVLNLVAIFEELLSRDCLTKRFRAGLTILIDTRPDPEGLGWANSHGRGIVGFCRLFANTLAANSGSYLARRADPERCERIVAYPCPAFAAVIYPVLRPLIPEGTGRCVVLLPGEAFADSPCPAGLDEFISLKAIRPDRRPQHKGLSPK